MNMHGMVLSGLVAAAVGLSLGTGRAQAQLNTFGLGAAGQQPTADDWGMLWQSADALNRAVSSQPGDSRSWSNPKSGNSGTVVLERVFERSDMPCHALRYSIALANRQAPQIYRFSWCLSGQGEWKILP